MFSAAGGCYVYPDFVQGAPGLVLVRSEVSLRRGVTAVEETPLSAHRYHKTLKCVECYARDCNTRVTYTWGSRVLYTVCVAQADAGRPLQVRLHRGNGSRRNTRSANAAPSTQFCCQALLLEFVASNVFILLVRSSNQGVS